MEIMGYTIISYSSKFGGGGGGGGGQNKAIKHNLKIGFKMLQLLYTLVYLKKEKLVSKTIYLASIFCYSLTMKTCLFLSIKKEIWKKCNRKVYGNYDILVTKRTHTDLCL